MGSGTTFRFTLWGAEEANGNVGQTEVLKFPEASRTQFARHFVWIEMAKPRLSERTHSRANRSHISSAFRGIVFYGLGIVEHDLRLRWASDVA